MVGDEVHVPGAGVLIFEIDGGRKNLVAEGEHGDAGFEASGAAQQMAGHRFGGTDREFVLAKEIPDGLGFQRVANRGRRAMRINVADVGGLDAGIADGIPHDAEAAFVLGRGRVMWKASPLMP